MVSTSTRCEVSLRLIDILDLWMFVSSDCQCDWCVYFACIQAIFLVLVIIIVLAFVLSIKLKYKWLLCVLHGSINIILGLSCAILLAQYDTCLQCKHDACVAAAVFCVTSLLGGIILIIVVILKYTGICGQKGLWKKVSCIDGDVKSMNQGMTKRKSPEGRCDSTAKTDPSPRPLPPLKGNVPLSAAVDKGDASSRPQPPPEGNVPPANEDKGDAPPTRNPSPRRLPPLTGNVSPTVTSTSGIEATVVSESQLEEKKKKKKKKKKKRHTEDVSESKEMSEVKKEASDSEN